MCLIKTDETRGIYISASDIFAYLHLNEINETFCTIDESGERNMVILQTIIKGLLNSLLDDKTAILMIDELQIDLIYSEYRFFILPQRMVFIYYEESVPINDDLNIFNIPITETAINCQIIYRTFLVYNTILTTLLRDRNPFNMKITISVIFRMLGKCPNNKDRIKCCDLNYGGNAPGHIMCPPRDMVKKIFHYAKWAKSPNNYRRYFELILSSSTTDLMVLDWFNFITDFKNYFGVE
jgi:Baculovirus VP1054 protein